MHSYKSSSFTASSQPVLPQRSVLGRGQTTGNLSMMKTVAFASRLGMRRFVGMHALKGNRLIVLVRVLARKRLLDLLHILAFLGEMGIVLVKVQDAGPFCEDGRGRRRVGIGCGLNEWVHAHVRNNDVKISTHQERIKRIFPLQSPHPLSLCSRCTYSHYESTSGGRYVPSWSFFFFSSRIKSSTRGVLSVRWHIEFGEIRARHRYVTPRRTPTG